VSTDFSGRKQLRNLFTGRFSIKNHLTEAFRRRINKSELMDKMVVCGTTPITVPHQLVVPQERLCALYCGFLLDFNRQF
jgi:hypothetical protein